MPPGGFENDIKFESGFWKFYLKLIFVTDNLK